MVLQQEDGAATAVHHDPFLARLRAGPLLCDGAMGTQLYARGIAPESCFEMQTRTNPTLVEAVHRDYVLAGAQIIETNTYGANAVKLAAHGLADQVHVINTRGARLAIGARESTGETVFVAGAVGPLGGPLAPYSHVTYADAVAIFAAQIGALVGAGVDLLMLETFADLEEIAAAISAARAVCNLPIVAQMTFTEDDVTSLGTAPEEAVARLHQLGADVIGANCSVGPQHMLTVMQRMARALYGEGGRASSRADRPLPLLSAQPNAGWPSEIGGRIVYLSSPEYIARIAHALLESGVSVVGGCCGTTPEHIRALRPVLDSARVESPPSESARTMGIVSPSTVQFPLPATWGIDEPTQAPSGVVSFAEKLGRQFVVSAELRPPRGSNARKMLQGAALLGEAGVDVVNILDGARAKVFMNTLVAGFLVSQQAGLETILHMTTHDRNVRGLQSDLIGAHALGARSILALTGDPPSMGAYDRAKGVYDVDAIGLIRIIGRLNEGVDVAGSSIGRPTSFLVGCAFDPGAADLELQIERLYQKIEAGARFVMTQPVYDAELFARALARCGPAIARVPILMGLLPPHNVRHAEFLHNEMPGITLSAHALERMRRAGPDGGAEEGMAMACEVLDACRHLVAGVYIMPQFDRYDLAAQLVRRIRQAV